jgi:hypothetical protein
MTFTGTLANINRRWTGCRSRRRRTTTARRRVQITTRRPGQHRSGGAQSRHRHGHITVNAVNDAPVNSSRPHSVNEDTTLVFSSGNGNLISISDVDAARHRAGHADRDQRHADARRHDRSELLDRRRHADATMTFTGTVANINAALAGMSFAPPPTTTARRACRSSPDDQGNTGSGGALSDTDTVNITVNAVNDAPVNSVPGRRATARTRALVFSSGNGNLISIATSTPARRRAGHADRDQRHAHARGTTGLSFTSATAPPTRR